MENVTDTTTSCAAEPAKTASKKPALPTIYFQLIAVVGGVLGITALFLYWVDIDTMFSIAPLGQELVKVPYSLTASAIKVIDSNGDISMVTNGNWHIYCPALACIFAFLGLIVAAVSAAKPGFIKHSGVVMIGLGVVSIIFAMCFYLWVFDVPYTVTSSDAQMFSTLAYTPQALLDHLAEMQAAGREDEIAIAYDIPLETVKCVNFGNIAALSEAERITLAETITEGKVLTVGVMHVSNEVTTGFWVAICGAVLALVNGVCNVVLGVRKQ